jgi:ribosome-associated translation inhibitor RaiA
MPQLISAAAPDTVPLRELVEQWQRAHEGRHAHDEATTAREAALVRTVVEQRQADHELRHEEQHRSDLRAVDHAQESLEKRLEKLNELRAEVSTDRNQFLPRDTYNTAHEGLVAQVADLQRRLTLAEGKAAGAASTSTLVLSVAGVIATVIMAAIAILAFNS